MALSLAMIVALGAHLRTGRFGSLVLAGMCMGLVFLTKVELFVPAAFVALVGLLGVLLTRTRRNQEAGVTLRRACNRCATRVSRGDRKFSYSAVQDLTCEGLTRSGDRPHPGLLVLSFAGAALVTIGGAYALLRIQLPVAFALEGVLGNWNYLGGDLLADRFYLTVLGFDDPAANALVALRMFLGIAALGAIVLGADRLAPAALQRAPWSVPIAAVVFVVLFAGRDRIPWFEFARALPLTTAVAVISLVFLCLRQRRNREAVARLAPLALFAVYALVLLGKMILRTRFQHLDRGGRLVRQHGGCADRSLRVCAGNSRVDRFGQDARNLLNLLVADDEWWAQADDVARRV